MSKKLKPTDGFLSYQQDKRANYARSTFFALVCSDLKIDALFDSFF
jgi:hypothetical protein